MRFTKVGFYTARMKLMTHEELNPLSMASVRLIVGGGPVLQGSAIGSNSCIFFEIDAFKIRNLKILKKLILFPYVQAFFVVSSFKKCPVSRLFCLLSAPPNT
jgi:hypothetical protein